jgi:hypothetical protein
LFLNPKSFIIFLILAFCRLFSLTLFFVLDAIIFVHLLSLEHLLLKLLPHHELLQLLLGDLDHFVLAFTFTFAFFLAILVLFFIFIGVFLLFVILLLAFVLLFLLVILLVLNVHIGSGLHVIFLAHVLFKLIFFNRL